jgi:hypothetical protein
MVNCPKCNTGGCKEIKRWTMTGKEIYGKKSRITLATFECARGHRFRKVIEKASLRRDPARPEEWIAVKE